MSNPQNDLRIVDPVLAEAIKKSTQSALYYFFDQDVLVEMARQEDKWGIRDLVLEEWWIILSEEFGEVARAILEDNLIQAVTEATEMVAVTIRLIEKLRRTQRERESDQREGKHD